MTGSDTSAGDVPYDFEIERIVDFIKREGFKRILVQIPDGLKVYVPYIHEEITKRVGDIEIVFAGDSAWGSCLLDDIEALRGGYDLLIHIGHIEYPYYRPSHRTLFIPAYSRLDIRERALEELYRILDSYGVKRVGVFTVVQHLRVLPKILDILSKRYTVIQPRRAPLVMGCEYSAALAVSREVDAYVIVSGGYFHGIGLGLVSGGRPVVKLDLYEDRAEDLTERVARVLRTRIYKIHQASDARNWVLIDGVKGQNRSWYRRYLEDLITRRGGRYIVFVSENINRDLLLNIDTKWAEAYVVLACPRIPIDDLADFHKPVLTPAEARMALTGKKDFYSFPW